VGCGEGRWSPTALPRGGNRTSVVRTKQTARAARKRSKASDPAQGFILRPPENATKSATRVAASETGTANARNSKTTWLGTNPHY
jgi:hypothetical protein